MKEIDYALLLASGINILRCPRQKEPEIPEGVLKRIAEMTGIGAAEYLAACRGIHFAVETACSEWLSLQSMRAIETSGRSIRPVVDAARNLCDALAKLNEDGRIALQAQIDAFQNTKKGDEIVEIEVLGEGNPTVEEYETMAAELMTAANKAAGFRFMKRRVGAPKGHRDHVLGLLVARLRNAIEVVGKGRLTYDRPLKGGSLVSTLELLRPHIEFVPNPLPWRALQEMTCRKTPKKR